MSTTTTGISWTDRTWNPTRGCSRVSEGCVHCYAEGIAARFSGPGQPYEKLAGRVNGHPAWTGEIQLVRKALAEPLGWRKPARVFVDSMSDLFHDGVPYWWLNDVWEVMARASRHTFQILTKRPERMQTFLRERQAQGHPILANVWLGVSVEDQATANARIPHLLATPAALRFVSAEPLLGPLDLRRSFRCCPSCGQPCPDARAAGYGEGCAWCQSTGLAPGLDWVIVGGESGKGARPMHPDWPADLWRQCFGFGVPFHFKQWGAFRPAGRYDAPATRADSRGTAQWPGAYRGPLERTPALAADMVRNRTPHAAPVLFHRGEYLTTTGPVQQLPEAVRQGGPG